MRKMGTAVLILTSLLGTQAWAAEGDAYYDANGKTVHDAGDVRPPGTLRDEVIGIKPQAGVLSYDDGVSGTTSRLAIGLTLDWNVSALLGESGKQWFVGPSTGLLYSHTGAAGSNFVGGSNPNGLGGGGGNVFIIPVDLKLGSNITDYFRVSAHGGANVMNRSYAASIPAGDNNPSDSAWSIYPNIGGDVEFTLGRNVALILRPDFTLTPGNDLFTGTIGITAPLG